MKMGIDRDEVAWAAGFFDGEGSSGAYLHHGRPRLTVQVTQMDRRVLDRFQRAVWNGKVGGPWGKRGSFHYRAYDSGGLFVMELIYPFLSEAKQEQYQRALEKLPLLRRPTRLGQKQWEYAA